MEVNDLLDTPAVLPQETWYPFSRSGGQQRRSGRFGEEKNLFILLGFEPRSVQPVT
jgi:hypothetical protein